MFRLRRGMGIMFYRDIVVGVGSVRFGEEISFVRRKKGYLFVWFKECNWNS